MQFMDIYGIINVQWLSIYGERGIILDNYWTNKTAVITGATHGIGLRLAERLAEKGVKIATIYKSNDEQAKNFQDKIISLGSNCFIMKGDILDKQNISLLIYFERIVHYFLKQG